MRPRQDTSTIAIIGAGSWGTALAITLGRKGQSVRLWAHEPEVVEGILRDGRNPLFLTDAEVPESVVPTCDLAVALCDAGIVLTVMPSHVCERLFERMLPHLGTDSIVVSATKGIDTERLMRMSEIIRMVVSRRFSPRLCVLSGPSFAEEVAEEHPTAVVRPGGGRMVLVVHREPAPATGDEVHDPDVGGAAVRVQDRHGRAPAGSWSERASWSSWKSDRSSGACAAVPSRRPEG